MKHLLNVQDFKGGREATIDEYNQIRLLLDLDLLKRDTYKTIQPLKIKKQ